MLHRLENNLRVLPVIEIERKFLLKGTAWPKADRKIRMRSGYLARRDNLVCRVRQKDEAFYFSLKARIDLQSSYDFEYPVPDADGRVMLDKLCDRPPVSKTRHVIKVGDLEWEVDEFHEQNDGLIVAEIELPSDDYPLQVPDWVGQEVTGEGRYTNYALYQNPWCDWDSK